MNRSGFILLLFVCGFLLLPSGGCVPEEGGEEPLRIGREAAPLPSVLLAEGSLRRGETPMGWALRHEVPRPEADAFLTALEPHLSTSRYRTDDHLELLGDSSGVLSGFAVVRRDGERLVANRSEGGGWTASLETPAVEREIRVYRGSIENSLWESLLAQGATPDLVVQFADIFSWTFDFLTECRRGDRFEFLVETQLRDGELYRFGPIVVARYEGARGGVAGVRYQPDGERVSYYAPDGTSLRKIFLRSPLNYRRISSGFTYRRFHPILKKYRPHLGIDYVAPIGTPVVSVGDGVVTYIGWKGGFGNYVEVKHGRSFTTTYGHLSRFPRGLRKGMRVGQGEVVGYVGSTGLSTGPHLDFRMTRGGKPVNPLSVNVPSADPVPVESRREFYHAARVSLTALSTMPPGGTMGKGDVFSLAFRAGVQAGLFPVGPEGGDRPVP